MGCGSSTDNPPPKDGKKPNAPPGKFEPFTEFPTPRLLAKAQRDYTASNQPHDETSDHADLEGEKVPKPFPPPKSKAQVFKKEEYADWDKRARTAPDELVFKPLQQLVDYLVQGAKNDIAKVRAFYVWIACARAEDYNLDQSIPQDCPIRTLLLVRARRYSYNVFFQNMCKCAKVPCILVTGGGVKGAGYMHGEAVPRGNSWCLVYVDKAWRFVDQHFGSFYVTKDDSDWSLIATDIQGYGNNSEDDQLYFSMDEDYFIPDPEQFIYDHFSLSPEMQLLGRPVTEDEFTQMARIYNSYFQYGFVDLTEPRCKLTNETGEVEFSFETKPDSYLIFRFAVFKQRGTKARGDIDGEDLLNFARFENNGDKRTFRLRFKKIGLYKIELMVMEAKNRDTNYWLVDYVVYCKRPYFNLEPEPPLPNSLQELGPGADWKMLEIEAKQQGGIIEAVDGYAQLNLQRKSENIEYMFILESQKFAIEVMKRCHMQDAQASQTTLHMKLPSHGNYLLKAHTRADGDSQFQHTCNYFVTSDVKYVEDYFPADTYNRAGALGEGKRLLKPISHPQSLFDAPSDAAVELTMQMLVLPLEVELALSFYDNVSEKDVSEYLWYGKEERTLRSCLRFPEAGTYKLLIKTKQGSKGWSKSWLYLIDVPEPTVDCTPFPTATTHWSRDFRLVSPNTKILKENEEVPFEVEIPGANQVYLMQDGDQIQLQESGSRFKGQVKTGEDVNTLVLIVHLASSAVSVQVLAFEVLGAAALLQENKKRQRNQEAALKRRLQREKDKETERKKAEQRAKQAEEKAEQERQEFERNKDALFEEEKRLEKEALSEHEREVKRKEEELELLGKGNLDNEDEIIKNEVEDAKKEQDEETSRRRQEFSEMQKLFIRMRMREATTYKQQEKLAQSVQEFQQAKLPEEEGDLTNAKKTLGLLTAKNDLLEAMRADTPELSALYKAIDDALLKGYETHLMYEIGEAEKLAAKLERMKRRRYRILEMNSATMMELRGYKKPSKEVHEVIQATLLLLGQNEDRTRDWKDCQRMFKTTGNDSILRAIHAFDAEKVEPEIAARVKEILARNDRVRVRSHSAGAATMFVWGSGVLQDMGDLSDHSPARVDRQKELLGQVDQEPLTPKQWAARETKPNNAHNRH